MTFQLATFVSNHKYCDAGDYNSEVTEYQDFDKALIKTNSPLEREPTETSKGKTVFKEEQIK